MAQNRNIRNKLKILFCHPYKMPREKHTEQAGQNNRSNFAQKSFRESKSILKEETKKEILNSQQFANTQRASTDSIDEIETRTGKTSAG